MFSAYKVDYYCTKTVLSCLFLDYLTNFSASSGYPGMRILVNVHDLILFICKFEKVMFSS